MAKEGEPPILLAFPEENDLGRAEGKGSVMKECGKRQRVKRERENSWLPSMSSTIRAQNEGVAHG